MMLCWPTTTITEVTGMGRLMRAWEISCMGAADFSRARVKLLPAFKDPDPAPRVLQMQRLGKIRVQIAELQAGSK